MSETFPYTDKYMRYDERTHRYVLTVDYFIVNVTTKTFSCFKSFIINNNCFIRIY